MMNDVMMRRITIPPMPVEEVYLSEQKFKKTWLPMFMRYFAGQEEGVVSMWATNVAGNFYKPVHIVANEKNPGEILFTVPALLNNNHKIYSDEVANMIPNILTRASKHNDVMPGSGDKYILNNLIDSAAPSQPKTDEEDAWRAIYRYYDIEAPFVDAKSTASLERSKIDSLIEGFDDDF